MKKSKKKNKTNSFNKRDLKQNILNVFYENQNKTFNYQIIAKELRITDKEVKRLINVVLLELFESGRIEQPYRGRFKISSKVASIIGKIEILPNGSGLFVSDELEQPMIISARNLQHAMDGDEVKAAPYAKRKGKGLEGEVIEIVKRAKDTFVGVIERSRHYSFLIPTGKSPFDIFIPNEKLNGAESGQKAVVRITDWPARAKNPNGEVIEVLGRVGENNAEMNAILAEYNLPLRFPEKVLNAAERIADEISEEEISLRRDMRKTPTFTIDPADAKDFDDALSIEEIGNNLWEIGIHIADVSHYVRPNTILDDEAYERATSVYLVDRVIPMLPEKLSNGVCSLRPNEDKLCFSAIFQMNAQGEVKKEWFGRTVIHSNRRFTYEEAQNIIETEQGDLSTAVLQLHHIAQQLRAERFTKGSIGFDRVEVKFEIDEQGKPLSVYFKEAKESNKLVEEFMLLANKRVAEFIGKKTKGRGEKTFVYRIHDRPNAEKLDNFNHFINKFGYNIQTNTVRQISDSMNSLLTQVEGRNEQNVIEILAIRTMAKAEYSTRNIGHYGLGFDFYSHFTSPIRRYPDVMVHRLLERYLDGKRSADAAKYEENCKHCSERENLAANAERSSIKYKQVEFMQDKIGQQFKGVISGLTDWGIYVELDENKCEGMIPMRELDDDFYSFDEKDYCLYGQHSGKAFHLGEKLTVEITRANLERKQLDFKLIHKVE
ncbi:MAG: ribonuclease R [Mangrovibacterium sp.]